MVEWLKSLGDIPVIVLVLGLLVLITMAFREFISFLKGRNFTQNGTGTKIVELLSRQTTILERQENLLEDIAEKLDAQAGNMTLAMERQKTSMEMLKEIKGQRRRK
jgi:hypothetical protein